MSTQRWWFLCSSVITCELGAWTSVMAASEPDWGPWGMHRMWGGWGLGMMTMMVLFWATMIVGLVVLIRWLTSVGNLRQQGTQHNVTESPLDILQKRYARGEISKEEFQDMRQVLRERD